MYDFAVLFVMNFFFLLHKQKIYEKFTNALHYICKKKCFILSYACVYLSKSFVFICCNLECVMYDMVCVYIIMK